MKMNNASVYYEPLDMEDHVDDHTVKSGKLEMVKALISGKWIQPHQREGREKSGLCQDRSHHLYPYHGWSTHMTLPTSIFNVFVK